MAHFNRRQLLAAIPASAVALNFPARAQAFPAKPITLVVPYPAGGPTDVIARIVAQDLATALGQNVVVDNRAGASGAVGTRGVARGDADGHTIVFGNNQTHGNNMFLLKEPGYDAVKDFAPLAGVGAFEHAFVVRKDLPAANIQELIALAKKDPGKLNYGSTGVGSGSHLSTELFMARTGIKMTHVPFRGAAPLVQELIGGRIDVANSTLPSVLTQIQSGDLRALAVASPQRNAAIPNVPTLREQGVTNADADSGLPFSPRQCAEAGARCAVKGHPRLARQTCRARSHCEDRLHGECARSRLLRALSRPGDQDLEGDHRGGGREADGVIGSATVQHAAGLVEALFRKGCSIVRPSGLMRICRGTAASWAAFCVAAALGLHAGEAAATPARAIPPGSSIALNMAGADKVYRSCRRQVRRAAGIIPAGACACRAYIHLVDRCVANGGIYS